MDKAKLEILKDAALQLSVEIHLLSRCKWWTIPGLWRMGGEGCINAIHTIAV
jgi:hypothetical protein